MIDRNNLRKEWYRVPDDWTLIPEQAYKSRAVRLLIEIGSVETRQEGANIEWRKKPSNGAS